MLKKTITYKSVDGTQTFTDDFYFHLSKAELVELEISQTGGMEAYINRIIKAEDGAALVTEFKKLVLMAYGERSDDGRHFVKNDDLRQRFASTEAYSQLFIELATDADVAAEFFNGIMPEGLEADMAAIAARQQRSPNRAERRHPSDSAAQTPPPAEWERNPGQDIPVSGNVGDIAPGESRNIFEGTSGDPIELSRAQMLEMDADELKSGLSTGRYTTGQM